MRYAAILTCALLSMALPGSAQNKAEEAEGARIHKRILDLQAKPACGIALEAAPSWPVPDLVEGKRRLRLLFYPVVREPGPAHDSFDLLLSTETDAKGRPRTVLERSKGRGAGQVASPTVEATLDLEGQGAACRRVAVGSLTKLGPQMSEAAAKVSTASRHDRLLGRTAKVARLFFAHAKKSKETAAAVGDYFDEFDLFAEPALRKKYLELNPAFWKWVEDQSGRTLVPGGPR